MLGRNVVSTMLKRPLLPNARQIVRGTVKYLGTPTARQLPSRCLKPSSDVVSRNNQYVRGMMSIPQVMFDPSLPHVSVPSENGFLHRNIRASYPKNAHKVVGELNALFAEQSSNVSHKCWTLEPSCDAISRFIMLSSREQVAAFAGEILNAADELNHHPSVTVCEGPGGGSASVILITCATHRPTGLSVKDPRLARKIDEIARDYTIESNEDGISVIESEPLKQWHWRENIGRALPNLDVREEDSSEGAEETSSESLQGSRFWRLNKAEDIEAFLQQKPKATSSGIPTFRGLMP